MQRTNFGVSNILPVTYKIIPNVPKFERCSNIWKCPGAPTQGAGGAAAEGARSALKCKKIL